MAVTKRAYDDDVELAAFVRRERALQHVEGVAFLRAFIRNACGARGYSSTHLFGELLKALVEDGVSRGWVRLKEGYAVANSPEHWEIEGKPSEDPEYFAGLRARREARQSTVLADPDLLARSIADRHEADALNLILTLPAAQHAALRALDVPMTQSPMLAALEAARLVADLGMVANGAVDGVPVGMLERVKPYVTTLQSMKSKTWEAGLITALTFSAGRGDPRKRVDEILSMLAIYARDETPTAFSRPTAKQLTAAREYLRTLRLAGVKATAQPAGARTGAGRPVSPRRAAAAFAECFGVRMEGRDSRARRRKK